MGSVVNNNVEWRDWLQQAGCVMRSYWVRHVCIDGTLLGVYDGQVRRLLREEGEATVHSSKLLQAVTQMTGGTRYSLILFFDRMRRTS